MQWNNGPTSRHGPSSPAGWCGWTACPAASWMRRNRSQSCSPSSCSCRRSSPPGHGHGDPALTPGSDKARTVGKCVRREGGGGQTRRATLKQGKQSLPAVNGGDDGGDDGHGVSERGEDSLLARTYGFGADGCSGTTAARARWAGVVIVRHLDEGVLAPARTPPKKHSDDRPTHTHTCDPWRGHVRVGGERRAACPRVLGFLLKLLVELGQGGG